MARRICAENPAPIDEADPWRPGSPHPPNDPRIAHRSRFTPVSGRAGRRPWLSLGLRGVWRLRRQRGRSRHGAARRRVRRIGVLKPYGENDPDAKGWLSGFTRAIQELGWTDGRNLRMDVRWAGDSVKRMQSFAKDLVDLQPDVILAPGTPGTAALQRETRTIPIVFVSVVDPVGLGFVASPATVRRTRLNPSL
jgi:hypothetical protein